MFSELRLDATYYHVTALVPLLQKKPTPFPNVTWNSKQVRHCEYCPFIRTNIDYQAWWSSPASETWFLLHTFLSFSESNILELYLNCLDFFNHIFYLGGKKETKKIDINNDDGDDNIVLLCSPGTHYIAQAGQNL